MVQNQLQSAEITSTSHIFARLDGESSQAPRDTSNPRATVKPFMAGDGPALRYVPPHARPLPKGERYDPSQAGSNYLQQLQQMQQSSKDASAKDASSKDSSKDSSNQRPSIMKFKRAVDLIRKSKPDVRASLKNENSRPISAALDKNNRPFSCHSLHRLRRRSQVDPRPRDRRDRRDRWHRQSLEMLSHPQGPPPLRRLASRLSSSR